MLIYTIRVVILILKESLLHYFFILLRTLTIRTFGTFGIFLNYKKIYTIRTFGTFVYINL